MKYKKYPSYKDSGVEWLGEIPAEWQYLKIKNICTFDKGYGLSKKELSSQGIYKCLLYGELFTRYKYHNTIKTVISRTNYNNTKVSKGNEILIPSSTTSTGIDLANAKYLPHSDILLGGDIIILLPRKNNYNFKYVSYFLTNVNYGEFAKESKGVTIVHIYSSAIREMPIFLPPIHEQQQIANFLDNETVKIDTLIEKQTKLIEILKEKRQAVISHAVTKGINPDVKMKDSGVEWLGDIPEHWEVKRTKFLFKIKKRIAGKEGYQVLSITQQGIKEKDTESGAGQLSMDYSKYQFAYIGDFAMNHMDLLTGYVDITKYDGVISPDYRVFTLEDKNSYPNYYLYLYQNGYKNKIFYKYGQGSSQLGRWRLPTEQFNEFRFPYPPLEEQQQIANYLDDKTSKMDKLIEKANKSIELLKEKRTALISAAVTGKIDVREEV